MVETRAEHVLVLGRAEVEPLLHPDQLRGAVARAMADLSAGRVSMPNRVAANVAEHDALLAAMPAYLPSARALTTKLVTLFPDNVDLPTHQAVLVCFDPKSGAPLAVMDGTAITTARTAAGSALSADLLARKDARVLAVLGTGAQARGHALAVVRVRTFERVVIAGRDRAKAQALADALRTGLDERVEPADAFADAVRGADVVCATTHAVEPVVRWEWVRPGTHVTSVGFNSEGAGEVDADTVAGASVFVESREAALAPPPSGAVELNRAMADRRISADRIREIGEVVSGSAPGRTSAKEVTLYRSVGVAVQDAAAAAMVLAEARRLGVGTEIEL
jgi:ornithine cyclodeaminase